MVAKGNNDCACNYIISKTTIILSSILLGLSAMMHKKHASKNLIDSLSYLGLCSPYHEMMLFEASVVNDPENYKLSNDSNVQFIFDNADHNTNTIDGLNTFHAMGRIMCVTPSSAVSSDKMIEKLKQIPTSQNLGKFGYIPLKNF